jgi:hypothetical protein
MGGASSLVRVFDIVDLERETQAAVVCGQSKSVHNDTDRMRSLEDTMIVGFRTGEFMGTRQDTTQTNARRSSQGAVDTNVRRQT